MTGDRIEYLFHRFFNRQATSEETQEMTSALEVMRDEERRSYLMKVWESYFPDQIMSEEKSQRILKNILDSGKEESIELEPYSFINKKRNRVWKMGMTAAAAVLVFLFSTFVFRLGYNPTNQSKNKVEDIVITPGGDKAQLILSNGESILLDTMEDGVIVNNSELKAIKLSDGILKIQTAATNKKAKGIEFNTLITPRGGQYQIILQDGSVVWLNSSSSLTYPVVFGTGERRIMVKGEVYADIAKDADRPFKMDIFSKGNELLGMVEVLGTEFNVNAYKEESFITTLVEGKVKLKKGNEQDFINPLEQALISNEGIAVRKDVNVESVIAWKKGLLDFDGDTISEVMEKISNWYDINVSYENVPQDHFVGTISRGSEIKDVLQMLEMTGGVHFKIEGRKVIVLK